MPKLRKDVEMNLAQIQAKRHEVLIAMRDLAQKSAKEGRDFTAEENTKYEELKAQVEAYDKQIVRVKDLEKQLGASALPVVSGVGATDLLPTVRRPRAGSLKNFTKVYATKVEAEAKAFRFGQFMLASVFGNSKSANWCVENGIQLVAAASEGVNSAGGYLVPEEFVPDIIDLRDEYGMFRRLCRVVPMGRDTITNPRRVGGLKAYPVGEGKAGTESQKVWDNIRLTAQKWMVLTLMSTELDEDAAINIGDDLLGEIAYAFAIAEDEAGWIGDGSAAYHGIRGFIPRFEANLGTATQMKGAVDAAGGHPSFLTVDANDISTLMGTLPLYAYQRGNPSFYCSNMAWAQVFSRLIQAAGGITRDERTGREVRQYLGFPVEVHPSLPSAGANDKVMILFGDIGLASSFGDRRGMAVARSTEYKFAEDQVAIKATERFDINIHDIGTEGTAGVAGPVVALIGTT
jgi:HK97 family phage major capsid protein